MIVRSHLNSQMYYGEEDLTVLALLTVAIER